MRRGSAREPRLCRAPRNASLREIRQMILYHVDAFTDRPFGGNPAAVCLLPQPGDESWMHALATELNLPMTAFVHPDRAPDCFRLRWFGRRGETQLCGHATLATAPVLWQTPPARPAHPLR